MPHCFGAVALQIGEDGVGEVDVGMVAGDHAYVVALLEGGIECFDEFLVIHIRVSMFVCWWVDDGDIIQESWEILKRPFCAGAYWRFLPGVA